MATTSEIEMIVAILADGNRVDRNLRRADDGHLFTTPDRTFLTSDGPVTPPYVQIPVASEPTDLEEWAEALANDPQLHPKHCSCGSPDCVAWQSQQEVVS